MKRYIKLSLLLLLIPLFVKNVYAEELIDHAIRIEEKEIVEKIENKNDLNEELEEKKDKEEDTLEDQESNDDIKTGTSKDNEITKELIIDSIDKIYVIDLEETDNLSYNEESKVKKEIRNIIDNKLNEKNYDLDKLEYKYDIVWNYQKNNDVKSYTFILYDKQNNELLRKELSVSYNNSDKRNEEDNNKIESFLEGKNLNLTKEYSLEELLSNIKENKYLYLSLNEHLTNIFEKTSIDYFVLANKENVEQNLSGSITEQVVLSINGIIYKTIIIENKYITVIEVPCEEDKVVYVENYLKEKFNDYEYTNIEEIRFTPETNCVFIKSDEEKSLGSVMIKEIKNDYKYMSGANSTIYNTDHLQLEVNGDRNEFKRIEINKVEVNPIYYSISNDSTKITIKNEFIKALNNGKYTIDVIFKSGRAQTSFTITTKSSTTPVVQRPTTNTQTRPYYPSYTVNTNNYQNTVNDTISKVDDDEEDKDKETEEKDEKDKEEEKEKDEDLEAGKDIDLDKIFEVEKDNDTDADSKKDDKKDEEDNHFMELLKSRYVPIIIVTIVLLIGGVTAYVFLKSKEEDIL